MAEAKGDAETACSQAAPHYVDMIDQTTLGHRLLLEQFNVTPTIGWQLDPFGHSATQVHAGGAARRGGLQPRMLAAAALRAGGHGPVCWRLGPCVLEAAVPCALPCAFPCAPGGTAQR